MGRIRPGLVVALLVGVMFLASLFLVQTHSRSSILVKEFATVLGGFVCMLTGLAFVAAGRPLRTERIGRAVWIALLALLAWVILRQFTGTGSVNGPKVIFNLLAISGTAVVMSLFMERPDRDKVLWIMVVGAVLLSVYAILQDLGLSVFKWDANLISEGRSSGSMGNPNLLGSLAAAMAPVGAAFLASRKRFGRLRWVIACIFVLLCVGAVIASRTRGSLIGLFAVMIILPFVPAVRRKGVLRSLALLLVVLVILAGAVLLMLDRMQELTDSEDSGTLRVRRLIWSSTLSMIGHSPIVGWGTGSFQIKFPEFRDPGYHLLGVSHNTFHAHCEYLEILSDTGIVGLLLWAALLLLVALGIRRRLSPSTDDDSDEDETEPPAGHTDWTALGLVLGILALLSEAIVSVALRWPTSGLLLGLLTGLLYSSLRAPRGSRPAGSTRLLVAVPLAAAAITLAVAGFPEYSRSMRSGKQLFAAKDTYLRHVEDQMMSAVQAAESWMQSGDPEQRQMALIRMDNARAISDSSVVWSMRCVETNPSELGGWYALGSSYLTRAMLYRPLSAPLITILESEGRITYDHSLANADVLAGMAAYDSLSLRAPYYAEMHNNLALAWSNLGNPDSAASSIRTAWHLHAHNRDSYGRQMTLMAPLTSNPDAIHVLWLRRLDSMGTIREDLDETKLEGFLSSIFYYTGTVLLANPTEADSIASELISMADSLVPSISDHLREGLELQTARLSEDIELLERFQAGDTAGMLEDLSAFTDEETRRLPAHEVIMGLLIARNGDTEGMRMLDRTVTGLVYGCFQNFQVWPGGMDLLSEYAEMLVASGLETQELREIFLRFLDNLLLLDRHFTATSQMMTMSADGYSDAVPEETLSRLTESWQELGGPLYCHVWGDELRDSTGAVPLTVPGNLTDRLMTGLEEMQYSDSTSSVHAETAIAMYYIVFISFYSDAPSFSNAQGQEALEGLRAAREMAAGLLGEEEFRYRLGAFLTGHQVVDHGDIPIEYHELIESLRSDIIMNTLPPGDGGG